MPCRSEKQSKLQKYCVNSNLSVATVCSRIFDRYHGRFMISSRYIIYPFLMCFLLTACGLELTQGNFDQIFAQSGDDIDVFQAGDAERLTDLSGVRVGRMIYRNETQVDVWYQDVKTTLGAGLQANSLTNSFTNGEGFTKDSRLDLFDVSPYHKRFKFSQTETIDGVVQPPEVVEGVFGFRTAPSAFPSMGQFTGAATLDVVLYTPGGVAAGADSASGKFDFTIDFAQNAASGQIDFNDPIGDATGIGVDIGSVVMPVLNGVMNYNKIAIDLNVSPGEVSSDTLEAARLRGLFFGPTGEILSGDINVEGVAGANTTTIDVQIDGARRD